MFNFLLIFFALIFSDAFANSCTIVMGASCSGKSTLCKSILKDSKDSLKLIDLDDLEIIMQNKYKRHIHEVELVDELVKESNNFLNLGYNIIIDTNIMNDDILNRINSKEIKRILVYCPLDILLKRDLNRAKKLNRTEIRNKNARDYVVKTFNLFEKIKEAKKFDKLVTS